MVEFVFHNVLQYNLQLQVVPKIKVALYMGPYFLNNLYLFTLMSPMVVVVERQSGCHHMVKYEDSEYCIIRPLGLVTKV